MSCILFTYVSCTAFVGVWSRGRGYSPCVCSACMLCVLISKLWCSFSPSILPTVLRGWCYHPHLAGEKTELRKVKSFFPGQSWDGTQACWFRTQGSCPSITALLLGHRTHVHKALTNRAAACVCYRSKPVTAMYKSKGRLFPWKKIWRRIPFKSKPRLELD